MGVKVISMTMAKENQQWETFNNNKNYLKKYFHNPMINNNMKIMEIKHKCEIKNSP